MIGLILATVVNSHATVTLKAPEALVPSNEGAKQELVLEFKVKPEWHIYWKNPGDSGEEPRAQWKVAPESLRPAISLGDLEFPIPERLAAGPFTNFGYSASAPIEFRVPVKVDAASLEAHGAQIPFAELGLALTYLVCKEECVPESADLNVRVPLLASGAVQEIPIEVQNFPVRAGVGSFEVPHRLRFAPQGDGQSESTAVSERLAFELPDGFGTSEAFEFFPQTTPLLVASDKGLILPTASESGRAQFEVKVEETITSVPEKISGLLVDRKRSRAEWVEYSESRSFSFLGLLRTLAFAFLGGVILNLMPCVFPVVSLKVLSFVREGAGEAREIRRHAYAYTAGILLSLWVLVGVLLAVRAAGAAAGWGFQLQNPIFLFLLLGVFVFLGLNLLGVFEFNYSGPGKMQNLMMKRGLGGSFFTGLLTTVVATPCSAPFLGVAIGYSLAGGALEAFVVFTALALGLAAPYLVLALKPSWIQKLPRPGAWMETLKEFLAFPLFLTAVWLFWVLSQMVNVGALIPVLAWCVFAGFFAWALGRGARWKGVRVWLWVSAGFLVLSTFIAVSAVRTSAPSAAGEASVGERAWGVYSDARLADELAKGHSVFIDFTASWCVTCQINKRFVLATDGAKTVFDEKSIVRLRADWTKRDSEITNALSRLGRNSVPVYAFYRAGEKTPRLLPEILTMEILKTSLEEK